MPFIDTAIEFYRKGGYKSNLVTALTLKIDGLIIQGDYRKAALAASDLRATCEAMHDSAQAIVAVERLAYVLIFQGDYPQAIRLYKDAEAGHHALGHTLQELYAKANRADLMWRLGQSADALKLLDEVQKDAAPLGAGAKPLVSRIDLIRGGEALSRRNFSSARRFAESGDRGRRWRQPIQNAGRA